MNPINIDHIFNVDQTANENALFSMYYEYFKEDILEQNIHKLRLFNEQVFINGFGHTNNIHNFFWKLASFDLNETYDVYPCANTRFLTVCESSHNNKIINLNRKQCVYRGSYIPLIKYIFEQADIGSTDIMMFIKPQKFKGQLQDRLYIHFNMNHINYLIVLAIKSSRFEFISGHPVTYKYQFDKIVKDFHTADKTKNVHLLKCGIQNYFAQKI